MTARAVASATVALTAAAAAVAPATSTAGALDVLELLVLPVAFSAAGAVALRHDDRLPAKSLAAVGLLHLLALLLAGCAVTADGHGWVLLTAGTAALSTAAFLLGMLALLGAAFTLGGAHGLPQRVGVLLAGLAALGVLGPLVAALGSTQRLVVELPGWPASVAGTGAAPALAGAGGAAAVLLMSPAAAAVIVVVRWRRARGTCRRRLRWPAAVLAVAFAALVVQQLLVRDLPARAESLVGLIALGMLPFALLPSVMAGDSDDDERLAATVRTTLALAALWSLAATAYAAVVATVQPATTGRAWLATGFLLVVGLAPVLPQGRAAVLRLADRLAHGPAVDGYALLRDHGAVLARQDGIREMCAATAAAVQAALGASWAQIRLQSGDLAGAGGGRPALTIPLEDADGVVGELLVGPRRRGSYRDRDLEALHLLAGQAALGLRRQKLAEELAARVEELAASRHRIAVAADEERRRIERDLHDGAQQDLVALLSRVELARTLLGYSADEAAGTIDELRTDVSRAIASLRRTVLGIHPPVLTDQGLIAAVATRIRDLPLDVVVDVDAELRARRFPAQVEATAYYVVVESLTNVLKHGRVASARVRLACDGDHLVVEVADDGAGGADPARGTGLAGLGDRLAAVGGTLHVDSPPGAGTRVRGILPVPASAVA